MLPGHSVAQVSNEQIKSAGGRPWQRADTETGLIGENSTILCVHGACWKMLEELPLSEDLCPTDRSAGILGTNAPSIGKSVLLDVSFKTGCVLFLLLMSLLVHFPIYILAFLEYFLN